MLGIEIGKDDGGELMKKLMRISIFALVALFLVGCDSSSEENNTRQDKAGSIQLVKETDPRVTVASALSDNLIVFEYQLPKEVKRVILWVDIFENGEKVESYRVFEDNQPDQTGLLLFEGRELDRSMLVEDDTNEASLMLRTITNTSNSGNLKTQELFEYVGIGTRMNEETKLKPAKSYPILLVEYTLKEEAMIADLSTEFMDNPEAHLKDVVAGKKVCLYRFEYL